MSKQTIGTNREASSQEMGSEHASLAADAEQWIATETDLLTWRRGIKAGDKVAIEFHNDKGDGYVVCAVTANDGNLIKTDCWDAISVTTGLLFDGAVPPAESSRLVRLTPEIEVRTALVDEVEALTVPIADILMYLPVDKLMALRDLFVECRNHTYENDQLTWRQSLAVGDEVAIEMSHPIGVGYMMLKIDEVENGRICPDNFGWFSMATGDLKYADGPDTKGPDSHGITYRIVRPTPEIREHHALAGNVEGRAGYAADNQLFEYLPTEDLRALQAILSKHNLEATQ